MSRPSRPDARRCPVCGRPATDAHAPFCSAVCRDRDLIAWLDGGYVVPGPPADPDADG